MAEMMNDPYTPIPQQALLQRERLDRIFENAIAKPLVTVTAGTGYGKTKGTSMFVKKSNARVAWVQLSQLDNLTTRFWESLVQAFKNIYPKLTSYMEQSGFPHSLQQFDKFLHNLAKEIYSDKNFILVLDDLHLITENKILYFLETLVSSELENFTVILISRSPITLNFSKQYSNNLESQIVEADLKFTLSELRELLALQNATVDESFLRNIMEYTEGWTLPISLISLSLKRGTVSERNLMAGILPFIFSLIENEIFNQYSPYIQNFLIELSFLEEIPIDMLKELAADPIDEVYEVINSNMFIHYNSYLGNCTFHYMFLVFLKEKQAFIDEDALHNLYIKVGDWYYKNNRRIDAITYYDKCSREDKIMQCMIFEGPIRFSKDEADFYIGYINKFTTGFIDKNPSILMILAGFYINNTETQKAYDILIHLVDKLESKKMTVNEKNLLGEVYIFLGISQLLNISEKCTYFFKKACEYLPNGAARMRNRSTLLDNQNAIYLDSLEPGSLDRVVKLFFETIPYSTKAMCGCTAGLDLMAAAEAAFYTCDLNNAKAYAYQAIYKAKEYRQVDTVITSYFILIRSFCYYGDYDAIFKCLADIEAFEKEFADYAEPVTINSLTKAWTYMRLSDFQKADAYMLEELDNATKLSPTNLGRDRIIKAFYLLQKKEYYELLGLLDQLTVFYKKQRIGTPILFIYIAQSVAYYYLHEIDKCLEAFDNAYKIAYGNNLAMSFIELGNNMRTVIETVKAFPKDYYDMEWLNTIYSKSSTYAKRISYLTNEYQSKHKIEQTLDCGLSQREREILTNLCQGLTREEIADSLQISPNTVKSTLQNIYNKLGAINLADAVRIAVSMNLV